MNRLALIKQIPLAVCMACAFVAPIHAQHAGTAPLEKLCKINLPMLGLPTGIVVAVAPTSNCPAATTEIQAEGQSHSAVVDADGTVESSDGGFQVVSHDPNTGITVVDITIPPNANDIDFKVQPGPEVANDDGVADDITEEVNEISNDGTTAEFQIIAFDNTTDQPEPDNFEKSNDGYIPANRPVVPASRPPISVQAPSSPGCGCNQSQALAGLSLRKAPAH